jgi:hypothetical protein
MNKIKITSIMIVTMFIGMGAASMCRAGETLNGEIKVEVKELIGLVYPTINLVNQTNMPILVTRTLNDTTHTYTNVVNDSLVIKLNITDNSGREIFLLPRTMFYMVFLVRKGEPLSPIGSYFRRLMPIRTFGSVNVVNSTLGLRATNITIPLNYRISNDTFNAGENLTVKVLAMGFLPGTVDGVITRFSLIVKAEFSLKNIDYQEKELIIE